MKILYIATLTCLLLNVVQATFLENIQIFLSTASGSSKIGERCLTHTDCVQGAYCEAGLCRCLATHVPIDRYCWKKMSPEESGCSYDEQCEAVWPGSRCNFSICKCPPNMKSATTREGTVCHIPGQCPTNGAFSQLYNRNTDTVAQCHFFDGDKDAGRFIGCDDFPELYDCVDGLCCPTRALTCIQPPHPGGPPNATTITVVRWHYNVDSRECLEFEYSGEGGNSNNFITREHCESYCSRRCPRGQPQLDLSPDAPTPELSCSATRDTCDERYECTNVDGASMCCPKNDFICSDWGGVVAETLDLSAAPNTTPFSAGSNRLAQQSVIRYYWDNKAKSCRSFKYHGQGGNYNNFLTEESCNSYCGRAICPLGGPLRDSSGVSLFCSNQSDCPRSHQCNEGVCCPTAATVCNQPLTTGISCSTPDSIRYWYNAATGSCQEFRYDGCQGNSNNFVSTEECHKTCSAIDVEPRCPRGVAMQMDGGGTYWRCGATSEEGKCPINHFCHHDGKRYGCCPTKGYVCTIKKEEGTTCNPGASVKWYFDANSNSCRSFPYKGCDGNANNFATQMECLDYCQQAECSDGGNPLVSSVGDLLTCSADESCPDSHYCARSISLSLNNRRLCCPSRRTMCSEKMSEGEKCAQPIRRYFFDPSTLTCRAFFFGGCGGNSNNFATKSSCYNFCHSAACASNELVYTTSSDVFDCSTKSCPRSHSCVHDVWNPEKKVCCASHNFGVCPSEHIAQIEIKSQSAKTCTANERGFERGSGCSADFQCLYNQQMNEFYCCSPASNVSCPVGSRMMRSRSTGDSVHCSSDSQCGPNTKCHQPIPYKSGVCCHNIDGECPPNFILDEELTEAGECSPLDRESCNPQAQSVCLFSDKKSRFVCCKREERRLTVVDRCPPGSIQDSTKIFCSHQKKCPMGFFCVRRDSDRIGLCCHHPQIGKQKVLPPPSPKEKLECPGTLTSFIDVTTSSPQQCNARFPCPPKYKCTPVALSTSRICCSEEELKEDIVCDDGTLPISIDGKLFSCQMKSCPPGYRCSKEKCCPNKEIACTDPPFSGTTCDGEEGKSTTRFFFDISKAICSSFDFRGCNPSANTFTDEKACKQLCLAEDGNKKNTERDSEEKLGVNKLDALKCPLSHSNPADWPQICNLQMPSCGDNEECVSVSASLHVCCSVTTAVSSSLRNLMLNMCGPDYAPVFATTGDPLRCSRQKPCGKEQKCIYSTVLLIDICCAKVDNGPSAQPTWMNFLPADGTVPVRKCDSSNCERKLYVGDRGCVTSTQCRGQSVCARGICTCRANQVHFKRMCYSRCPLYYKNIKGVCV